MSVLFLSPFPPRPLYGGAVVRIHHLVRRLCRRYDVVWGCRAPGDPEAPCPTVLNSPHKVWQIINPVYVWRLLSVARRARVLVVSSIISGLHALIIHGLCGVPLIYDAHNVEHLLMRRLGNPGWRVMAVFEWLLCRCARAVWTVSDTDAALLQRTLGVPAHKISVVPNGVDMQAIDVPPLDRHSVGAASDEVLILFFGVLTYAPNAQAVQIIKQEIAPRLDRTGRPYRIVIAGTGAEAHVAGRLRWLGFVDNLYGLIRAADVVIVPITTGSGTRMKILESMACGTPVVSTSLGVEGLPVDTVLVTDDWDRFVAHILTATRRMPSPSFVSEYDWDGIVGRITL